MIAINRKTGERRELKVSLRSLERASDDGVDYCTGPCQCRVEPDGDCPQGWPSRIQTMVEGGGK